MADHPKHPRLLKLALPALLVATFIVASAPAAEAHNTWNGGYRKWPWKAGTNRTVTTLPGECPHCSGQESTSAWKAIDVSMNYETVYSISPGAIALYQPSGGKAGIYLLVRDVDGSYITYEHLSKALVTSGTVVAGQPIAVSGCSGNCSGAHLHFQRQDGTTFSSNALSLVPISGHGGTGDPLAHAAYTSDNAGIGYSSGGTALSAFVTAYNAAGGYKSFGVTADVGAGWSPCRYEGVTSTWWRYGCTPRSGVSGSVQTFYGSGDTERAIMLESGAGTAFVLHHAILSAYTDGYSGHDWVYWLGYPIGNRYATGSGSYRQNFRYGYIMFDPVRCRETIYLNSTLRADAAYCD